MKWYSWIDYQKTQKKNQKILYDMACNCEIHLNSSLSFSAIPSTLSIHFNLNLI